MIPKIRKKWDGEAYHSEYTSNEMKQKLISRCFDDIEASLIADLKICVEHFPNGCNWGQCMFCGVLPLHHKLLTGEVIEKLNIHKKKEIIEGLSECDEPVK